MFGYVVPKKCELKVKDFYAYRSAYCSLCKELSRLGPFAKLTLGYDFTFAALLALSLCDEMPAFRDGRCTVNPLLKQRYVSCGEIFPFAAACSLLSVKYKLRDDLADESFFKKLRAALAYSFLLLAFSKAKARLPKYDELFHGLTERQKMLEQTRPGSCDKASEETAKCLSSVFEELSASERDKRVLSRLGYFIGKFVYMADALGDLDDDVMHARYNPAAVKYALSTDSPQSEFDKARDDLKAQLFAVQSEIAACYALLEKKRYAAVLDNIVYLGLKEVINNPVPAKKEEIFDGRPV